MVLMRWRLIKPRRWMRRERYQRVLFQDKLLLKYRTRTEQKSVTDIQKMTLHSSWPTQVCDWWLFTLLHLKKNENMTPFISTIYRRVDYKSELLLLSLNPLCLSQQRHSLRRLCIRVQLQHHIQILQKILLHHRPLCILLNRLHRTMHLLNQKKE